MKVVLKGLFGAFFFLPFLLLALLTLAMYSASFPCPRASVQLSVNEANIRYPRFDR